MSKEPFDRDALIDAFIKYDRSIRRGRGQSGSPDSGHLGWGESGLLDGYIKLYEATADRVWLDKIVDHFDRMIGNSNDAFGDGFPTWVTVTYSVGLARTGRMHNRGTARIAPEEERVWVIRGAEDVGGARRIIEIVEDGRYRISEYGSRSVLGRGRFRSGRVFKEFAPFNVAIEGKPKVGDRFWVETLPGEPLEYIVHQGMFLYPVSRFIEHGLSAGSKLPAKYKRKAKSYLGFISEQVADKHERDWVKMTAGCGGYRFSPWLTERFPNRIMPHNQYLALARAFLMLADVSRKKPYAERTAMMARNFKRHLRKTGRAYTWYYWDWIEEGQPGHSAIEDTGHGHIDIGFAVEACRRGVVFTKADLKRFSWTLLDQMWNGSRRSPRIGSHVDRKTGDAEAYGDWIDLCQWNPQVWDIIWKLYQDKGQPAASAPSILQGWKRLQEGSK